jgi:PadR family transcriptional regulator AphA
MLVRYAILTILEGREIHGYRIKALFAEHFGPFWSVNFGQVYQTLKQLKHRGLIVGRLDQDGSHIARWVYSITPKGRRALATWLQRAPRRPQSARHEILIRLLNVERRDLESSLTQLEKEARVYKEYLGEVAARRGSLEPPGTAAQLLAVLAAEAEAAQIEAHLQWIARCAELVTEWKRQVMTEGHTNRTLRS